MATGETQIDNEAFRVVKWTIEAGDAIPMHRHQFDYVVVPLTDGTMRVTGADGVETTANLTIGQSYTRVAGSEHTVANAGTSTIEFVEVEKL